MKRFFFRTVYTKAGKKFDYFIEFGNRDIERVINGEITVDSINDFTFGIICIEKNESRSINLIQKEKKEFGSFRVFIEDCLEIDILPVISRQISDSKREKSQGIE